MESPIENQKLKITASLAGFKGKDLKQAAIVFLNTLVPKREDPRLGKHAGGVPCSV